MEFTASDRLKLRVDALNARLREVSSELSALKGSAFQGYTGRSRPAPTAHMRLFRGGAGRDTIRW